MFVWACYVHLFVCVYEAWRKHSDIWRPPVSGSSCRVAIQSQTHSCCVIIKNEGRTCISYMSGCICNIAPRTQFTCHTITIYHSSCWHIPRDISTFVFLISSEKKFKKMRLYVIKIPESWHNVLHYSVPAKGSLLSCYPVILLLHKHYQAVTVTEARTAYWIFRVNQSITIKTLYYPTDAPIYNS